MTTTHFDSDSFVAVWGASHPAEAVVHEQLLRRVAHVGDFRELGSLEQEAEMYAIMEKYPEHYEAFRR